MKIGLDYIGVSAGAVITNDEGKYFLAKRGPASRDDIGKWEFPGGIVDFYESREEAVQRILHEKHDLDIIPRRVLGVYDVIDQSNKDHWVSTTYVCRPAKGSEAKIMQPTKCVAIGWFTFDQLRTLQLSRITRLNVADLRTPSLAAPQGVY